MGWSQCDLMPYFLAKIDDTIGLSIKIDHDRPMCKAIPVQIPSLSLLCIMRNFVSMAVHLLQLPQWGQNLPPPLLWAYYSQTEFEYFLKDYDRKPE